MSDEERITDIEMSLAHLQQQLEDMNSVVLRQGELIDYLKAKLRMAESKIEELESDKEDDEGLSSIEIAARDKPPHY